MWFPTLCDQELGRQPVFSRQEDRRVLWVSVAVQAHSFCVKSGGLGEALRRMGSQEWLLLS